MQTAAQIEALREPMPKSSRSPTPLERE